MEKIPSPYENHLGVRLLERGQGFSRVALAYRREVSNFHGIFHGGAIASMADTAAVQALRSMGPGPYLTAGISVKYHQPSQSGELIAEARAVHLRSKLFQSSVLIKDADGQVIAEAVVRSFLPAWTRKAPAQTRTPPVI